MRPATRQPRQSGFSMIEMLMAAFILAIGILGLSMLQVMSMRAARGSRSMSTAVQVAEAVLDRVEMEGRLTWLNATDTLMAAPPALTTPPTYVNQAAVGPIQFTIKGRAPNSGASDPADRNPFFTVNLQRANPASGAIGAVGGQQVHDFTVTVTFQDIVDAGTGATVVRNVVLTRRIIHA